jgi:small subunit ribosomal protein S3e
MKGSDPEGLLGPRKPLPDSVQIFEPSVDKIVSEPSSEQREPIAVPVAAAVEDPYASQEPAYQPAAYTEPAPVF